MPRPTHKMVYCVAAGNWPMNHGKWWNRCCVRLGGSTIAAGPGMIRAPFSMACSGCPASERSSASRRRSIRPFRPAIAGFSTGCAAESHPTHPLPRRSRECGEVESVWGDLIVTRHVLPPLVLRLPVLRCILRSASDLDEEPEVLAIFWPSFSLLVPS